MATLPSLEPYDGVLLLSFGGPQAPEQVMPFLRSVTAGRGVPDSRLAEVAEHYAHVGGISPIGVETRALQANVQAELQRRGLGAPVLLANRHLSPSVLQALREAAEAGLHRLVTILTSAYPSYSSCRQYREDLAQGWQGARDEGLVIEIDKLAPYAGSPAWRVPQRRLVIEALRGLDVPDERLAVLFVTHSVPETMDERSGAGDGRGHRYSREHLAVVADVMTAVHVALGRQPAYELVFCSRSGPPAQPWLEPDVNDRMRQLAANGVQAVVAAPIGFVSDHMEVVYDLDTEAAATAAQLGLRFVRVPTVGRTPEFAAGLVDLLLQRAAEARGELATPPGGLPAVCAPGCCPNLRHERAALCGAD
ncbi:MAG: ferrochelatase [Dermatophilaceae bacterium]